VGTLINTPLLLPVKTHKNLADKVKKKNTEKGCAFALVYICACEILREKLIFAFDGAKKP
jgi:hypothetical protein